MKKTALFITSFIIMTLVASCGKSPQEKLVGEWETIEQSVTFNSDGTYLAADGDGGEWELIGNEGSLTLKLDNEIWGNVTFISDDEIDFLDNRGFEFIFKRIKRK